MKAELTINELKHYLGTGAHLMNKYGRWHNTVDHKCISIFDIIENYKLCLRPMSDLTKEIEHNGEMFVPIEEVQNYHNFSIVHTGDLEKDPLRYPFSIVKKLFEWHFNVFNLDPSLWVDKNTL